MSDHVLFSDILKGRFTEDCLVEDEGNESNALPSIKFINSKEYFNIKSISIDDSKVYLSFYSRVASNVLRKENKIRKIILKDEEFLFETGLDCKFYNYDVVLNFEICTIVIDEEKFWSDIENVRYKNQV